MTDPTSQAEFARQYLDHYWPKDWDDQEWEAAEEDWGKELDGILADGFLRWKGERDQQKAEAVQVSR